MLIVFGNNKPTAATEKKINVKRESSNKKIKYNGYMYI